MGELMSMGIPLICNSGVGDVEQILLEGGNGLLVHNFNDSDYNLVVNQLDRIIQMNPQQEIACAEKYYSLENGINLYDQLYRRIAQSL
jgi:hypothetical protein